VPTLPKPPEKDPVPKLPPSRRDSFGKNSNRPSRLTRGASAANDLLDLSSLDLDGKGPTSAPSQLQTDGFDFLSSSGPATGPGTAAVPRGRGQSSSPPVPAKAGSPTSLRSLSTSYDPNGTSTVCKDSAVGSLSRSHCVGMLLAAPIPLLPPPRSHASPVKTPKSRATSVDMFSSFGGEQPAMMQPVQGGYSTAYQAPAPAPAPALSAAFPAPPQQQQQQLDPFSTPFPGTGSSFGAGFKAVPAQGTAQQMPGYSYGFAGNGGFWAPGTTAPPQYQPQPQTSVAQPGYGAYPAMGMGMQAQQPQAQQQQQPYPAYPAQSSQTPAQNPFDAFF
jgi:hypothetical protein